MVSAPSAMGYDAYFTVLEALWNTSYSGITGEIPFDSENGDANRSTAFIKKVDKDFGTWKFITVQSVD